MLLLGLNMTLAFLTDVMRFTETDDLTHNDDDDDAHHMTDVFHLQKNLYGPRVSVLTQRSLAYSGVQPAYNHPSLL